jgi:hypothetical protein
MKNYKYKEMTSQELIGTIAELNEKINELSTERDNIDDIKKEYDKFDSLSNELSELRGMLYKVELRLYMVS